MFVLSLECLLWFSPIWLFYTLGDGLGRVPPAEAPVQTAVVHTVPSSTKYLTWG